MPDWQRQILDSDGKYPLDPTRSSNSQKDEPMTTGGVDADSDLIRTAIGLSISSGRDDKISKGTETVDEFELKRPGT
eukprot:5997262-Amphidinium_carterae.1